MSVISVFSQWESRRKEGLWDGGKHRDRWAELEVCSLPDSLAQGKASGLGSEWEVRDEAVKGVFCSFWLLCYLLLPKTTARNTTSLKGCCFLLMDNVSWWGEGMVKRAFPLCISLGDIKKKEGCGSTCTTGEPRKPWQRIEEGVCLILLEDPFFHHSFLC